MEVDKNVIVDEEKIRVEKEKEESLAKLLSDIKVKANKNCSKCYGRGHRGIANRWQPILCNCVMKVLKQEELAAKLEKAKVISEKIVDVQKRSPNV